MAFSPMGIINACLPRQAALEALHVGAFIHNGPSGFCRDAAAAMSAAVAVAFSAGATVEAVLEASTAYLMPASAAEMRQAILWGANFGRDADTIATMVGGLAGALHGGSGIPTEWVKEAEAHPDVKYREPAERLAGLIRARAAQARELAARIDALS